jgi:hypothetical protein
MEAAIVSLSDRHCHYIAHHGEVKLLLPAPRRGCGADEAGRGGVGLRTKDRTYVSLGNWLQLQVIVWDVKFAILRDLTLSVDGVQGPASIPVCASKSSATQNGIAMCHL